MKTRSLSVLAATALCGIPLTASAVLLAYDGFAYPPGSVVGRTGGTGWGDAWAYNPIFNGGGTTGGEVVTGGLSYAGLASTGGSLLSQPGYEVADRAMFATAPVTGVFYFSFLLARAPGQTPGYGGVSIFNTPGNFEESFLGFTNGSLGVDQPLALSGIPLTGEEPALLVFRFDLDSDIHQLYANPVVGAPEPAPSLTFTDAFDFARVGINADPGMLVDEFRLGQTFADVTPVPEPGSALLAVLGAFPLLSRRRARRAAGR